MVNRGQISSDIDKVGMQPGEMIYVIVSAIIVIISMLLIYRIERKRNVAII
jgi:hypothetical protein